MPTTSPSIVTSGPPELPGLAAASNWIRLVSMRLPSGERYSRLRPETTPAVTDGPMPNGKPTATTSSPGARSAVERRVAGAQVVGIVLACSTARSFSGCTPITVASDFHAVEESARLICSAPATTCRLVRMMPLSTITTPVPTPICRIRSPFSLNSYFSSLSPCLSLSPSFSLLLNWPRAAGFSLPPSFRASLSFSFALLPLSFAASLLLSAPLFLPGGALLSFSSSLPFRPSLSLSLSLPLSSSSGVTDAKPITRTTDGSIAANALVAIDGSGLFSSVCSTAASMSFCVSSRGTGRV